MQIINITLLSLPRLAVLLLARKAFVAYTVQTHIPPFDRMNTTIERWLLTKKYSQPIEAAYPVIGRYLGFEHLGNLLFNYSRVEKWLRARFGFDQFPESLAQYRDAFILAVRNHMLIRGGISASLNIIASTNNGSPSRFLGTDQDVLDLYQEYYGKQIGRIGVRWTNAVINLGISLAIITALAMIVAMRTRLTRPPIATAPVGTTLHFIEHEAEILRRAVPREDDVIFLFNDVRAYLAAKDRLGGFRFGFVRDGRFSPRQAWIAIVTAAADILKFWAHFYSVHPALSFRLSRLPFYRIQFEALFRRYQFKRFYIADYYSETHVIRTQALHAIGCKVVGRIHGVPMTQRLDPPSSVLAMDVCHVLMGGPFIEQYKGVWDPAVMVRPVATVGYDPDSAETSDTKDVLIYLNAATHETQTIEAVHRIADSLPDRQIWVKIKGSIPSKTACRHMIDSLNGAHPNLHFTDEDPYLLFRKGRYVLTDYSTILIDSLQCGVPAFLFDFNPKLEFCLYRDLPGVILNSGQEAVQRINDIESNRWTYPLDDICRMIEFSRETRVDSLRRDLCDMPAQ